MKPVSFGTYFQFRCVEKGRANGQATRELPIAITELGDIPTDDIHKYGLPIEAVAARRFIDSLRTYGYKPTVHSYDAEKGLTIEDLSLIHI